MSKDSLAKCYQNNKKDFKKKIDRRKIKKDIKVFLKKKKKIWSIWS